MPPPPAIVDRFDSPDRPSHAPESPPHKGTVRVAVATECTRCGYESDDASHPPRRCPKCGGSTWSRFAKLTPTPDVRARVPDRPARGKRTFVRPIYRTVLRT
jgi:hypothetical protein